MTRLIKSELLKIRTTNTWWIFTLGVILADLLALTVNCIATAVLLDEPAPDTTGMDPEQARQITEQYNAQLDLTGRAAEIFTSGQFFGGMLVLLFAALMVTNEFYHQMATSTFLASPHRTSVIVSKLITATSFAALVWVVTTAINLVVGSIFLNARNIDVGLGNWPVQRAIIFNLLVYALWAILGVGFGVLIRNQVAAVVTGTLVYLLGTQLAQVVFFLVHEFLIKQDWVLTAQVSVPAIAAQVFLSPVKVFPQSPPYWVGGLVLLGYGVVAGVIGTTITRRRDIS